MQKNKVISFTILLLFIVTSNSKLFSENDTQNTMADQTQQQQAPEQEEETFFQRHRGTIITASSLAALLVASAIIYEFIKEEMDKQSKKIVNQKVEKQEAQTNVDKDYEEKNKKSHNDFVPKEKEISDNHEAEKNKAELLLQAQPKSSFEPENTQKIEGDIYSNIDQLNKKLEAEAKKRNEDIKKFLDKYNNGVTDEQINSLDLDL
jgi:hypothetical protein